MNQLLVCAHPWQLIQAAQPIFRSDPPEHIPAIYSCPVCRRTKNEHDIEPRVILGRLEDER